jgi:hypothetical protein
LIGMLCFELRKYVGGKWVLDTIFDDKTEAVAEAKSLMTRSRVLAAVRVVAVSEDDTGFKEWTVFKQTIVDEDNEQATQRAIQQRRETQTARTKRDAEASRPKPPPERRGPSWLYYVGLMARVVVIIGAGAFAIIFIQRQFL